MVYRYEVLPNAYYVVQRRSYHGTNVLRRYPLSVFASLSCFVMTYAGKMGSISTFPTSITAPLCLVFPYVQLAANLRVKYSPK